MLKPTQATALYRPISLLAGIGRQGRNYTRVVLWLLYEAFRRHLRQLFVALAFTILYLGGQMGAIGVIYGYARLMENHTPLVLPWINFSIETGTHETLWAVVAGSAALFLMSGVFQYFSRRIVFRIAEDHFAESLKEIIVAEGRLPDPRARTASQILLQQGLQRIAGGARRGALMAVIFFMASSGAIGALAALAFLVAAEPLLTLAIMVGLVIAAFSVYPIALRAVRLAKMREQRQLALNKELRELQQSGLGAKLGPALTTPREFAYAYMGRRRIVAELTLVLGIVVTIILAVVVYYLANRALGGNGSWAIFVAYIGALRLVLSGSSQIIRAFAGVSRFYPQIVPYYAFIQDYRKLDEAPLAPVLRNEVLRLGTQVNGEKVRIRAGDRVAVATLDSRRQIQFALLDAKVEASGKPVAATILHAGSGLNGDAAIVLAEINNTAGNDGASAIQDGQLDDKAVLYLHRQSKSVGTYGEGMLLMIDDAAIQRFVPLGSEESKLLLDEFDSKVTRSRQGYADVDEEDEDV